MMENKLNFLLDRNRQFDFQSAQMLDDLTLDLKSSTGNVHAYLCRAKKPTKYGRYLKLIITFGTMLQKYSSFASWTRLRFLC